MGTYLTQGLIIKQQNYREVDRKVIFYSQDFGKQTALARGSRKINSKMAGSLQPYTMCQLMLARGKFFDTIAAVEIKESFRSIKKDLIKIRVAEYFSHLINETSREKHRDVKVYKAIKGVFFLLNEEAQLKKNINHLLWYFIWKYLNLLGYQPELYKCVGCQSKILQERNFFNYKKGGLLCNNCHNKSNESLLISDKAIKLLRFIIRHDYRSLLNVKIKLDLIKEMNNLTQGYLNYSQEGNFSWSKFLIFN